MASPSKESLETVRKELERIVEADYWHTTQAYKGELGPVDLVRPKILELTEYLAGAVEHNIVTVQTEIRTAPDGMQTAREECIATLARAATRSNDSDPPRLLVFERVNEQNRPGANRQDQDVASRLRKAGLLDRNVVVEAVSPRDEHLLWAADLASWSFYHQLARDERTWFKPLEPVTTVLHARTGKTVKGSNPHLPQPSPGVQPTVGTLGGGGLAVASESRLVHQGKESQALHTVRAEADTQRPALDHSVSLGLGTNSPKTIDAIKERFDWYLKAQRSQQAAPESSEPIRRLIEQAQQALQEPRQPPRTGPDLDGPGITGPRR